MAKCNQLTALPFKGLKSVPFRNHVIYLLTYLLTYLLKTTAHTV